MPTLQDVGRITFGLFEVDLDAKELWKAGFRVRLPGQPFKVLTLLLAKPGAVVTREELQREVWGSHTNVDFERALAGAINKIREALGDSADNPRFVETLTRRGYRFIAPIRVIGPVSHAPSAFAPSTTATGLREGTATSAQAELPPERVDRPPGFIAGEVGFAVPAELPGVVSQRDTGVIAKGRGWTSRERFLVSTVVVLLTAVLAQLWFWHRQSPPAGPLPMRQLTRSSAISAGPPGVENLITLATDGDRVLTSVMEEGRPRLSSISLGTGEIQRLGLPQELASSSLADISKDGTQLLLRSHLSSASEQPLWIVPSSGGSALRVGNVLAHDAAWMPDGASVLYAKGNLLTVIRLRDGISTPFASLTGRAFWMRWSPDGKLLRYTLMDPVTHTSGLWELDSKGGVPRQVHTPPRACCGSWTVDGSAFVFQAGENLWQMKGNSRTGDALQLTNGPLRFVSPVTARSGSRIFFLGLDQHSGLQRFTEKHGFRPAPSFLAEATRVDYSRDGAWVAWVDGSERLWRARASDGSDKVQLTPEYLEAFLAHWSPDGKRLAVMAREPGRAWQIYLIDAAGGEPLPLLHEDRNAADPGWSADGKRIVFGREPDSMGKENGSHSIEIVDLALGQIEELPGSEGLFSPRWSPDGRWIVALSLDQKSLKLYDVAHGSWNDLVSTSAADPVWSADSQRVYVHAFLEEEQPILAVTVPDGKIHVVATLSGFHNPAIVNYFFGGITPANEPLVEPRVGTGNLYALDPKTP